MANLTSVETRIAAPYRLTSLNEDNVHVVDVAAPGLTDAKAIGTHNLITIPKGKALIGGYVIIETDGASGGAATVQFKANSVNLTSATAIADMTAKTVIPLVPPASGTDLYAKDAALTIDMVVATAALTALKYVIVPTFLDIDACLTSG